MRNDSHPPFGRLHRLNGFNQNDLRESLRQSAH